MRSLPGVPGVERVVLWCYRSSDVYLGNDLVIVGIFLPETHVSL